MDRPPRFDVLESDRRSLVALAARVRERRQALGFKQDELGERAGLSNAYVSRLENVAINNPKIWDLRRLAEQLQWTLTDLLEPADDARPSSEDDLRAALTRRLPANADLIEQVIERIKDWDPITQRAIIENADGLIDVEARRRERRSS